VNLVVVGRGEQDHFATPEAVENVKIVGHVLICPSAMRTDPGMLGLMTPSSHSNHSPLTRIDSAQLFARDVANVWRLVRILLVD
jgi:hypothetical protein